MAWPGSASGGRRCSRAGAGGEGVGDQQRRGDDEAVDQQHHAPLGAPSIAPAIIAISKPPYSASTASGIGGGRPPRASAGEQTALAGQAGIVETGAAAGHRLEPGAAGFADQAVGEQRGGGGVADAHLAEAHHVAAVFKEIVRKLPPADDRLRRAVPGPSRAVR